MVFSNPNEQVGEMTRYIWELERALLLITLEAKHNVYSKDKCDFGEKMLEYAEDALKKKPRGIPLWPVKIDKDYED